MPQKDVRQIIKTWSDNAVEELSDKCYDRFTLASTLQSIVLFNSPVNSTRQGATLTLADTNIISNQIPVNEAWALYSLGLIYYAKEPRTSAEMQLILDFLSSLYFNLTVNGKAEMFQHTGDMYFGPLQAVMQPAATQNDKALGGAMFYGFIKLQVPIPLQPNTNWNVTVTPYAASNVGLDGDKMRFVFDRQRFRNS